MGSNAESTKTGSGATVRQCRGLGHTHRAHLRGRGRDLDCELGLPDPGDHRRPGPADGVGDREGRVLRPGHLGAALLPDPAQPRPSPRVRRSLERQRAALPPHRGGLAHSDCAQRCARQRHPGEQGARGNARLHAGRHPHARRVVEPRVSGCRVPRAHRGQLGRRGRAEPAHGNRLQRRSRRGSAARTEPSGSCW